MPERWYSSSHIDERSTSSSSSRTRSTSRTEVGEQGNPTFEYSLHYTGPVSVERAVALLAREAKNMKRRRSSHPHDRYRESQAQDHSPRTAEDRSYPNQLVQSRDWSSRTIRSQSHPRHSNHREGYRDSNQHHGQACLCSQGHRNGHNPSLQHEHETSWSTTSDTLCDENVDRGKVKLPILTERPLPRIEKRGPSLYIVREARGLLHPQIKSPDEGPCTSCRIL